MSDEVVDDTSTSAPDRRSILKKGAIVGAGIWAAPVVTSITSPAFAAGSGQPGPTGGCITLSSAASVTATVTKYQACNQLEVGLQSPTQQAVCVSCYAGASADLGNFEAGSELTFYLTDHATCCQCVETYTCERADKATVTRMNDTTYVIAFRDNGCTSICPSPSNISEGSNLELTVTLGPPTV
jgi:hypothetical protein